MWLNRRLHIDLSTEKIVSSIIPEEITHQYLGGIGICIYYLYKEVKAKIDPLNEDNTLYFCAGPLQGTPITMTGRCALVSKSPLTGLLLDSNIGGNIGPEIKFFGYDIISISGKAKKLSYIALFEDKDPEIISAAHLKGCTTHKTEEELQKFYEAKDLRIVSIGPAGEAVIPYASLIHDRYRSFGRAGAGAIFGSKNLKALIIKVKKRNLQSTTVIDQIAKNIHERIMTARKNSHLLQSQGTAWLVNLSNRGSLFPTRNFQSGTFVNYEHINGEAIARYLPKKKGCFRCSLGCGFVIRNHQFSWTTESEVAVPEYETLGLIGGNLGIANIEQIVEINHKCNALGLDTITTGASLSFLSELKEKGLLPPQIQHLTAEIPNFGEGSKYCEILDKIITRKGIGDFLSQGLANMADKCDENAKKFAIHVKKLPMAAWDPRGKKLLGLSYATAAIGASHLRGWPQTTTPAGKYCNTDPEDQRIFNSFVDQVDLKLLKDSLIICHFTHSIQPLLDLTDCQRIVSTLFNEEWSLARTRQIASRIWILQRLFNIREFENDPIKYDTLPHRLLYEELPDGFAKGSKAFDSNAEFQSLLIQYYDRRGLDNKGYPLQETLHELHIDC